MAPTVAPAAADSRPRGGTRRGIHVTGTYPAARRVKRHSEFQRIQSGGGRVVSSGFVFLLMRSGESRPARLGITASRRVGCAVVRNRAKRLVREAFRATYDLWPHSLDVVVIVRRSTKDRSLSSIVSEWRKAEKRLERLWRKLESANRVDCKP